MGVHLQTAPATGSLPGRVFAVLEDGDDIRAIYELTVQDDEERRLELTHVLPAAGEDVPREIPEEVRESLAASGYTIVDEEPQTDGGESTTVATIRAALQTAKEVAPEERDTHIKAALGEVAYLRAAGVPYTAELQEQLSNVLAAPDEEAAYFINRALALLDDVADELHDIEDVAPTQTEETPGVAPAQIGARTDASTPLEAIATARELLQSIDEDAVDADTDTHLINALEQLDNILLDASAHELAGAGDVTDPLATAPSETPDEAVFRRHANAGRLDHVPVTIELTSPLVELIDHVRDAEDGESITDWIKTTVQTRLVKHDNEFWNSATVPVEAELPNDAAQWARLWADHYAATGSGPHDIETHLMNYVDLEFDWRVEGGRDLDVATDLPNAVDGEDVVDLSETTGDAEHTKSADNRGQADE
jgi:hypothetical protein